MGGGGRTAGGKSRGGMWLICATSGDLVAFGHVAAQLLPMGSFNEVNLVEGNLVSLVVVETLGDPQNGNLDRSIEPVRAVREGKVPLGTDRLMLGMGVWVYRNVHVRREAYSGVSEAWTTGHDVDGVAGDLVPSESGFVILRICVNEGLRELVQQDVPIVDTRYMFSPPAPTFRQLRALQPEDDRCF